MDIKEKYNRDDFCRYGVAPTVAGEIASALTVITQRWRDDGYRLAIGKGCEYVDFAGRYLYAVCDGTEVEDALDIAWGLKDDESYENAIELLVKTVTKYLNEHPELCKTPNDKDMWDYAWDEDFWDRDDFWEEEEESSVWTGEVVAVYDPF